MSLVMALVSLGWIVSAGEDFVVSVRNWPTVWRFGRRIRTKFLVLTCRGEGLGVAVMVLAVYGAVAHCL
jgi:hypothetical protein